MRKKINYIWLICLVVTGLRCSESSDSKNLTINSKATFRAATFNVDYKNRNFHEVANLISSVKDDYLPFIAGTQENQSNGGIARAGNFDRVRLGKGSGDNSILLSKNGVSLISQGQANIERDTHAERTLVWANMKINGNNLIVFNTHLPHGAVSNVAGSRPASAHSHQDAANRLIAEWRKMGQKPAVVVCDCNTYKVGGKQFKDALIQSGYFELAEDGGLDLLFFSKGSLVKRASGIGGYATEPFHRVIWAELQFSKSGLEDWHPSCKPYMIEALLKHPRDSQEVEGMRWNTEPVSWRACVEHYQRDE